MTLYMLDTNVISDLIRNPKGKVAKRIARAGDDAICTSIVVAAELRYGCAKSGSRKLLTAVEDILKEINVLPLEAPPMPCPAGSARNSRRQASRSAATISC